MDEVLAIDPGSEESAWVVWDGERALAHDITPNEELRRFFLENPHFYNAEYMAVEMVASYGMAVGAEIFRTCVWIGRFEELWVAARRRGFREVFRREVKLQLCGQSRAKDANVRQTILDQFGGRAAAMGKKKAPGPLYGVRSDIWAALGVAMTVLPPTSGWRNEHGKEETPKRRRRRRAS